MKEQSIVHIKVDYDEALQSKEIYSLLKEIS